MKNGCMKPWEWWGLALILAAGLLLRTAYLVEIADAPDFRFPSVDASFHDYWARALVSGDWAALPKAASGIDPEIRSRPYFRPPGYPFFLAGVYFLTGSSYLGARIVQMMLGLVNVVLAFFLGRRIFGPGVALVLAGFMSLYWIFIYYEGQLQAPVLLIFLMLFLAHVCITLTRKITWSRSVAAGLLMGIQALVRPNIVIFAPVLLIFEWRLIRKRRDIGSFKVLFAGLVLGTAAAVLPASIRNHAVAGELVLISSNAGVNLYIGNNDAANGRFMNDLPDLEGFGTSFDYTTVVRRLEEKMDRPLKYSEVSSYFTGKAWDFVKEHPLRFLELLLKKAALLFGPEEISHNNVVKWDRRFSRILKRIPGDFAFLLSLAVVGCMLLVMEWRGKRSSPSDQSLGNRETASPSILILLLVCAYSASFLPFFVTALYRVPLTPFLLLFGAYGSFRIGKLIPGRRSLALAGLAAALYGAMHLFLHDSSAVDEARGMATWHFNQAVSRAN
jgi:4-amino-4-deoxy-L-arabinose transferase-like glycosyltransferase